MAAGRFDFCSFPLGSRTATANRFPPYTVVPPTTIQSVYFFRYLPSGFDSTLEENLLRKKACSTGNWLESCTYTHAQERMYDTLSAQDQKELAYEYRHARLRIQRQSVIRKQKVDQASNIKILHPFYILVSCPGVEVDILVFRFYCCSFSSSYLCLLEETFSLKVSSLPVPSGHGTTDRQMLTELKPSAFYTEPHFFV